MATLSSELQ